MTEAEDDFLIKNMAEKTDVKKWSLERSKVRIKAMKEHLKKEFYDRDGYYPLNQSLVYGIHDDTDGNYPYSDLMVILDSISETSLFKSNEEYRKAVCRSFIDLINALEAADEIYRLHLSIERMTRRYREAFPVDETNS